MKPPAGDSRSGSDPWSNMVPLAMWRRTLTVLGALLVLFHAWLLGGQLWDGQLADPGLLLRWSLAAGLLASLVGLRRRGASLMGGRKAVAIWLLAALLHAPAVGPSGLDSPALPEAVATVLEFAVASVIVGLGLVLLAAIARGPLARPRAAGRLAAARIPGAGHRRRTLPVAPRPPPSRAPFR